MSERRIEDWLARRGPLQALLVPLGWLWGGVARVRRFAYDRSLLGTVPCDVPVVALGNLTAGGTGKTPMAALVVRALQEMGHRPGLLSRGYGAEADGQPNDEALELARLLPGIPHVQDADRARGAAELVTGGVTVVVMDDGFQHRRLARDLDIVLIDATRPLGLAAPEAGGRPVEACLPRGLLREPPTGLARADLIVLTRVDQAEGLEELELRIARWAPGVPVLLSEHRPTRLLTPEGPRGLEELEGRAVDLYSGIGNPAGFEASARQQGAIVHEHRIRPDHHVPTAADLKGLEQETLLTTGKDAAKLEALGHRAWVLEVALVITRGESWLRELLQDRVGRPGA